MSRPPITVEHYRITLRQRFTRLMRDLWDWLCSPSPF
jgi:hypothetical protein